MGLLRVIKKLFGKKSNGATKAPATSSYLPAPDFHPAVLVDNWDIAINHNIPVEVSVANRFLSAVIQLNRNFEKIDRFCCRNHQFRKVSACNQWKTEVFEKKREIVKRFHPTADCTPHKTFDALWEIEEAYRLARNGWIQKEDLEFVVALFYKIRQFNMSLNADICQKRFSSVY